jgi:hypothetical protein
VVVWASTPPRRVTAAAVRVPVVGVDADDAVD